MGAYVWAADNWQATDGSKYTGRRLRQLLGGLLSKSSTRPLGARSGVWAGTPTNIVTVSGTTVTVAPHGGAIDAQTLAIAGPYLYSVDAAATFTAAARDATRTRIDLVTVRVDDSSESDGTSGTPSVTINLITGTPGSGSAPTLPARSLALATVTVPPTGGASLSVAFVAPFTTANGGIIPCSGPSQYPVTPYVGQYVDDASLGLRRWNGSSWVMAGNDTGWQSITLGASYSSVITPQIRLINGLCVMQGKFQRTDTADLAANATVPIWGTTAFPASMRPSQNLEVQLSGQSAGKDVRGVLNTDGSFNVVTGATPPGAVSIAGFSAYVPAGV